MSFQLKLEQMPGYLAARFIGVAVPGEGSQRFRSIVEHCQLTHNDKLLIDTTRLNVQISFADRFFLGEGLRIFAQYKIKVAFVSRSEQIDYPRKFALMVAQNRGVTVETFTDFKSAEEWLLK